MPGRRLPRITVRQGSQSLPASTVIATKVQYIPGGGTHSKRSGGGQNARPLRKARFYPYDRGNPTASFGTLPESQPASIPPPFDSLLATSSNGITVSPQISTSSPAAIPFTNASPPAAIRTFPPTTALSMAPAPVPQPEPSLATESAPLPASSSATMSLFPTSSRGPNCPFATLGQPQPNTESTSSQSFPVIVTVLPIPAETSS
ncbi:hypothetical protein H2200_012509 [Cladophialophora chaetospira]|uniref:Uncharacterized protein n=1 Tax=Cladophialophora chaetospira TaxID=386627 RepID=A0AA39CCG7_9EURO|nr:hypothetical protein H2200_012509 [Cladophialophora chaetospira]